MLYKKKYFRSIIFYFNISIFYNNDLYIYNNKKNFNWFRLEVQTIKLYKKKYEY